MIPSRDTSNRWFQTNGIGSNHHVNGDNSGFYPSSYANAHLGAGAWDAGHGYPGPKMDASVDTLEYFQQMAADQQNSSFPLNPFQMYPGLKLKLLKNY